MGRLGERGVTLVELMIAMLLLATALVGLAAAFPYAMYGVSAGGFQTTATLLAQQGVELAKTTTYANLPSMPVDGGVPDTSTPCASFRTVSGYEAFTRCVAVQTATPTADTTTVTVVVRFAGVVPVPIYDTTVATVIAR